jgi:hypothetical protein
MVGIPKATKGLLRMCHHKKSYASVAKDFLSQLLDDAFYPGMFPFPLYSFLIVHLFSLCIYFVFFCAFTLFSFVQLLCFLLCNY